MADDKNLKKKLKNFAGLKNHCTFAIPFNETGWHISREAGFFSAGIERKFIEKTVFKSTSKYRETINESVDSLKEEMSGIRLEVKNIQRRV